MANKKFPSEFSETITALDADDYILIAKKNDSYQNSIVKKGDLIPVMPYATVGATGSDYTTINLAYAAGYRWLILVANTTLSADITVDNLTIELNTYTLDCGAYNFTINANKILNISGIGIINFAYSGAKILFDGS